METLDFEFIFRNAVENFCAQSRNIGKVRIAVGLLDISQWAMLDILDQPSDGRSPHSAARLKSSVTRNGTMLVVNVMENHAYGQRRCAGSWSLCVTHHASRADVPKPGVILELVAGPRPVKRREEIPLVRVVSALSMPQEV